MLDSELSSVKVSLDEKRSDKTFVLDLLVRFKRKSLSGSQTETVNVEMQTTSESHFTDRALAYSCRIYSQQLKKGSGYNKLFPVYLLAFTTKNLKEFKGIKDYHHICNIRRTKSPEALMSSGLCFVIIELGKFDKNVKQLYNTRELWCYLLKNSHKMGLLEYKSFKKKGGQMAETMKSLWNLSKEEAEREYIYALEKMERDRISAENSAHEKGWKKGQKEGKQEGLRNVVLEMLKKKMDISTIIECTGLPKEQILQLQKNVNL